jgi:malonyl-CoA O-methyltransferase
VSGLVLEHTGDLHHFFFKVHRVLRPEGRALLTAMHHAMSPRGGQAKFTDPDSGEINPEAMHTRSATSSWLGFGTI